MSQIRVVYILLLVFTIIMVSSGENHYCKICRNHTKCLYRNTKPTCKARSYGFTSELQNEIVRLHNKYRRKVASGNEKRGRPGPQPRAKYMPDLVWDQELANIAQTWANRCNYEHDSCRNVKRFHVGQNIAKGGMGNHTVSSRLASFVKLWYDEVKLFNSKRSQKYRSGEAKTGHYTQMLWAKTTKIGCGYVQYSYGRQFNAYLVCNYGPAGNVIGKQMYEIRK